MKYLLDTHILIWWCLDLQNLSQKYRDLLNESENVGEPFGLSIISLWEISKLVSSKKFLIHFSLDEWFCELEEHSKLAILPLSSHIILESTRLGTAFHKDPADQLIAATARCHGLRLLTADEKIIESGVVSIA